MAGYATAGLATSNTFSSFELYIPNYGSSATKPFSSFTAHENNSTTAYLNAVAGLAAISSAVTSLSVLPNTSGTINFVAGSSFHLYGIKNT
jgi:hypothetical protein